MKRWQLAIVFIVGVMFGVVPGWVLNDARNVALRSNVTYPLRAAIRDVDETAQRGNMELAKRKLHLLRIRWDEYAEGGPSPNQWYSEITKLADKSP